jgi:hypothetical protein
MRGLGSALAAGVFGCTLAALPAPVSARQHQHPPIDVPPGDIKVHGHWVIDVRNADGTPVERREFDNAITSFGKSHLVDILLRNFSVAPFFILVGSSSPTGPCQGIPNLVNYGPNHCFAIHPSAVSGLNPSSTFPTLSLTVGGPGDSQIILAGSITTRNAGQIDLVATIQPTCIPTAAPTTCHGLGAGGLFTAHDLRDPQGALAPIPVVAGQIVQVKVTFSFCGSEGCQS